MQKLSEMNLEELIDPRGITCECGKSHRIDIKRVESGTKAIESLPSVLEELKVTKPFLICDRNTYEAGFSYLKPIFENNRIEYQIFRFDKEHLEPDEHSVGSIVMAFDHRCDGILALGSGVLNDLGKVIGNITGLPLITIATAPSMDGYGSNNASMIRNRLKVSLYYACPDAIIADTRILKKAPFKMLQAGVGDMLAKYCSICEWRISHLITGEYYCENIAQLVRSSLQKILDSADALLRREDQAVESVFLGLLYTGLAMGYAGISRPASGLEHYFSHVWEMMNLERGETPQLHGIQVALGTLYTFQIWQKLKDFQPDTERAEHFIANFDENAWQKMVLHIYGETAGRMVINTAREEGRNSREKHAERFAVIREHWQEILRIVEEEMPPYSELLQLFQKFQLPQQAQDLGLSDKDAHDALIASREVRNKYVTSSLLWDLGLLYDVEIPRDSGLTGLA